MARNYRKSFIAPRYMRKARNIASRASDFYGRTAPMLKRTAPMWMPAVATAVKARPKLDRAVKLAMKWRNRFRRPTATTSSPSAAMEYVRTPSEGNSTSYFTRKALRLRGFKKRMMKAGPLRMRKTELVQSINWAYGRQGIFTFIHNTNSELDAVTDLVTTDATPKLLIQSTKIHYMISSGAKAGIKMRIYEGCYKRDIETAFNPQTLWQNGMIDTGSSEVTGNIDSKPWASPSFNELCHITKVTNLFLPQGRTHEHYATYGYNKLYSKELWNTSTNREYLRGWTRFCMFVCYGEPIADTDTDISTASGRVVVVATKTQRFRFNQPETYRSTFVQSIPVTGISSERLLDEGSGEVETNVVL